MAYSTIAQFRANVPLAEETATISDPAVNDKINQADDMIETDLSNMIDFSSVTDTPDGCPKYINLLSQYKTAEMCCVSLWGAKREVKQQTDRQYWAGLYDKLIEQIKNNEIDLGDVGTGTNIFENNYRDGIEPALGLGKWGEHIDEDEIEADREKYGNQE